MVSQPSVEAFVPPPALAPCAERLRQLTGFVTCLCPPNDLRALVLSRFFHVERVAALADAIGHERKLPASSIERVAWLAWAHDLNRWPFAHNSERPRFDQAADIPRFLRDRQISADNSQLTDLLGIIDKRPEAISEEARVVLLADMVAGFIEDPLWALTVIDLRPSFIPPEVATILGFPIRDPDFVDSVFHLNLSLFNTRDPSIFVAPFNAIFLDLATRFLQRHDWPRLLPFGTNSFEGARSLIKGQFMCRTLFPYNNERMSKGALLRRRLIEPLLTKLGSEGSAQLTRITEPEVIQTALELRVITDADVPAFYPDLDYVSTHEPHNSFRVHGKDDI
jgi:hypothetical protein